MRSSFVWRVEGASWLPVRFGYEDWYLLDDTCALDIVNREAVAGATGSAHRGVASLAGGGTAGLYRPAGWHGPTALPEARGPVALWFSKPYGVSYEALYSEVASVKGSAPAELWERMLVLGPTPEFCLLQEEAVALPDGWTSMVVRRTVIWPR
jgi:hypothetical protein